MKWWVLGGVIVAVAAFVALEMSANRQEAEWAAFVAKWEARGEVFDVAGNLPPVRPEAEEFFAHPWIRKVMAGDPAVLARFGDMAPGDVAGWDAWLDSAPSEPETAIGTTGGITLGKFSLPILHARVEHRRSLRRMRI